MAHTYGGATARTSSATNPITTTVSINVFDTVLVLMLKVVGATNRAGGSPTIGPYTFTQANTTQKAVTTPEASAELWYVLNPAPLPSQTLTIPNTGALTIAYTLARGQATPGGRSLFDGANGANNTAVNPAPGAVVTTEDGDIGFAITAGGWQTWLPTAQVGTAIANTDDGADGSGEQYIIQATRGSVNLGWTFATSDDWGAVAAFFKEIPPHAFNHRLSVKAGDGMSVSERLI